MPIAPPSHTRSEITTDSWITPKWLIDRLGPFDLDPCACSPYGKLATAWLDRLAAHGNGIALVFARTETKMFLVLITFAHLLREIRTYDNSGNLVGFSTRLLTHPTNMVL
jgi:hypothetical protein